MKLRLCLILLVGIVLASCGDAALPAATATAIPPETPVPAAPTSEPPTPEPPTSLPATTGPTEMPDSAAGQVLVKMVAEGGRCTYGVCHSEMMIQADGAYTFTDGDQPAKNGAVDSADLAELKQQIQATDFAAIKAQPFTGDCPTAYDGQEWSFEIATASGVEELRSCREQIDLGSPPFDLLMEIWDQARQS